MKKINLIILAGGKPKQWLEQYGQRIKACLPVSGKPMLDWVVEAYKKSGLFQNIVVVGDREIDSLSCAQFLRKRVIQGRNILQNLFHAALYYKLIVNRIFGKHDGYIISFCDAPLLTPEIIEKTTQDIVDTDADIVIHYVGKSVLEKAGIPADKRSYLMIGGKPYTGANMYYIRSFSLLLKCLPHIGAIRKVRKSPDKILELLGCVGEDFEGIDRILSKLLNAKVRLLTSPYPEMGIDVDKEEDYQLVNNLMKNKETEIEEAPVEEVSTGYNWSGFLKLAGWIMAIGVLGYYGQQVGIKQMYLNSLDWIQGFGLLSPLVFLLFYLILSGIFLPSLILKVSAGFLFGLTEGIIIVTIASTISSVIKFLLARYWCRDIIVQKLKENPQWMAIDDLVEQKGWKVLILLRNIPVVSSMFLNYICGLSSMTLKHFIYASSIGRLPSTILYVYLGCLTGNMINIESSSYARMVVEWILLVLGVGALTYFTVYCRRLIKKSAINLGVRTS